MKNLLYKSVSVMKKMRESSNAQISLAEKQNLIACIASVGTTHVECVLFANDNADLIAHGFTPSPQTIEAETKEWYDVIHAQPNVYGASVFGGYLKVLDRSIFCGMEGIAGFPVDKNTPIGSASGINTFTDNFNRTSIGTDYATTTSASGAWSISNNRLQLVHAGNEFTYNIARTAVSYGDGEYTATVNKGSFGRDGVVICLQGSGTSPFWVGYAVSISGTNTVILEDVAKIEQNPRPSIAIDTSSTFVTGTFYTIKVNKSGSTIKVKVWDASTTEPVAWLITATDSTYSSGFFGFVTEGFDKTVLWDDLTISPTFSLTSTWTGRYRNYLYNHVGIDRVQTGDIYCPIAEISGPAFSGNFWTTQTGAVQCVIEFHKVANAFAAETGKSIIFMNNPNFSETSSGWWGPNAGGNPYSDTGIVCYDYYGNQRGNQSVKPADYVFDLATIFAGQSLAGYGIATGGYPQFWCEWGDLSGSIYLGNNTKQSGDNFVVGTTTVEEWTEYWIAFLKAIRDGLVNTTPQKLIGFNYWGGWESQNSSILIKTGSGPSSQYSLNWRGQILRNFFINDGMARTPIPNGAYTEASPSFGGRQQTY